MNQLLPMLEDVQPFPVEMMAERALLKRVDTKFICHGSDLARLIPSLESQYGLLRAGTQSLARYQTLYFDSQELDFYHQHRRGVRNRFKVRIRHYLDRRLSFLEVKRKNNHGVTNKSRLERSFQDDLLTADDLAFLDEATPLPSVDLVPQIRTDFGRITLVGLDSMERLTIDIGLQFIGDGEHRSLDHLAIIEVKQPRHQPRSPSMLALRSLGLRPSGMSKYCTGQIAMDPKLPRNRFHPTLRRIERLSHV